MESGSISFRKPVAGSFSEQILRMAEILRGEINGAQAIRFTIKRGIRPYQEYSGQDLYRSAVNNELLQGKRLWGARLS